MKIDEIRPLPEKYVKTLREHKKAIEKIEKENKMLMADLDDIIRTYKEQEGGTPMNVECLSVLLHNRMYEMESLKRNTKRAISEAKGEM